MQLYVNGCLMADADASVGALTLDFQRYNSMVLGAKSHKCCKGHFLMDKFLIWDHVLDSQEAWNVYLTY